ncbi:hypothetical protein [Paenibacillus hamazuiensis]|uniref:hypothetical protein n=1 Tax=Paenibacillus hamazuiensis TaxID=2936508 RepID=UPI00200C64D2|nr:hypothetical protein [Paenibacillus hamazuiensis]
MASFVYNVPAAARSPIKAPKGNSTVYQGGGYLFYCDNPETIRPSDLADAGRYLNQAYVNGAGQVYLWHENGTPGTITHCLLIYNPNNHSITVSSSNYGKTNGNGLSDTQAWADYFAGNSTSIQIAPNQWGSLFSQNVNSGHNVGIVARTNITNSSTGAASTAVFYDLAYVSNSSGATEFSDSDGTGRPRGVGSAFYLTINLDTIAPTTTDGIAYGMAAGNSNDIFGTSDLVWVSGQNPGYILGNYGIQHSITMKVRNDFSQAKNFYIYFGTNVISSPESFAFPVVNMYGYTNLANWINGGRYVDLIQTGEISPGSTATVSFFMVVGAISSTPWFIGARPV